MPSPRELTKLFLRVLLFYFLFMAAWPVVQAPFLHVFRDTINCALRTVLASSVKPVAIVPYEAAGGVDTALILADRSVESHLLRGFASHRVAYIPLALYLSLLLASPTSWGLRALFCGVGLGALYVAAFLRLWLMYLSLLTSPSPMQSIQPESMLGGISQALYALLVASPLASFILAVILWGVVALPWICIGTGRMAKRVDPVG